MEEITNHFWCIWSIKILPPKMSNFNNLLCAVWAFQVAQWEKNPPANAGDTRDSGSIPGSGRSPAEGNSNPLHYFLWSLRGYSLRLQWVRDDWPCTLYVVFMQAQNTFHLYKCRVITIALTLKYRTRRNKTIALQVKMLFQTLGSTWLNWISLEIKSLGIHKILVPGPQRVQKLMLKSLI